MAWSEWKKFGGIDSVTFSETVSVGNETKTISVQSPENATSGTLILIRESYMNFGGSSIIFDETNINSYELLEESSGGNYPSSEYKVYKVSFIKGATLQFKITNNNSATGSTANGKMILLT